jgi:hypothetical protein
VHAHTKEYLILLKKNASFLFLSFLPINVKNQHLKQKNAKKTKSFNKLIKIKKLAFLALS